VCGVHCSKHAHVVHLQKGEKRGEQDGISWFMVLLNYAVLSEGSRCVEDERSGESGRELCKICMA
jgi:hypothetical protein